MPLFRRPDGVLVPDLSPLRRVIPYLMRTRNESVVYFEQVLDVTRTLDWIRRWNEAHAGNGAPKLTLFHVVLAGCGRALLARPGLNRFVSGGRIYQRRGVQISFAAKKAFDDDAPLVTVKLDLHEGEHLDAVARRAHEAVHDARDGDARPVDREVGLIMRLPGPLVHALVAAARLLDRFNLLPWALMRDDPMYASLFLANLGSVGIDRVWHHLYEYGTVSVFGALGTIERRLEPATDGGAPRVRHRVRLRFTYDERINDGFYCAASLEQMRAYVEDPESVEGPPVR